MSLSGFYHCGNRGESQVLRYEFPSLAYSGVTTTFKGGLITARHVVENQHIPGFTCHTNSQMDVAYRSDDKIDGLPLGWVDVQEFDVELLTASKKYPYEVVNILGRLGIRLGATILQPFTPRDFKHAEPYIKAGVSGSPLVFDEHIIGVVPFTAARCSFDDDDLPGRASAVVFNGQDMRSAMQDIGLQLPEEPLVSLA